VLDGIPPAPRGVPQVEVTFDLDANGILNVSAKDMATSKKQNITITASSGLSKDDIDKLVKDAQSHESEDKKRREEIELRNQTDSLVYATEKLVKENREKVPVKIVNEVETALDACKQAIKDNDADAIKKTSEALVQASHKMSEEMYKAAPKSENADGASTGDGEAPPPKKDDAIDAEFEEAKE
jgi:molecular chaperone DnaK